MFNLWFLRFSLFFYVNTISGFMIWNVYPNDCTKRLTWFPFLNIYHRCRSNAQLLLFKSCLMCAYLYFVTHFERWAGFSVTWITKDEQMIQAWCNVNIMNVWLDRYIDERSVVFCFRHNIVPIQWAIVDKEKYINKFSILWRKLWQKYRSARYFSTIITEESVQKHKHPRRVVVL